MTTVMEEREKPSQGRPTVLVFSVLGCLPDVILSGQCRLPTHTQSYRVWYIESTRKREDGRRGG